MPDRSGVYILQFANGIYVGSSKHVRRRILRHLCDLAKGAHCNNMMQRSHDQFGVPTHRLLLECAERDLLFYEQIVINGFGPRLNLSPTAGRNTGHKHSPETLKKMSESGTIAWRDRSRIISESHRRLLSKISKGRIITPETRAKISASKKGHTKSPETRAKISAAKKGRPRLFYKGMPWPQGDSA